MMTELPTCEACGDTHHSNAEYCIDCQKPDFSQMMEDAYRGDGL